MSETIVGVFAHPDDESFSCGGTLAQHAERGECVSVIVLSDGVGSRFLDLHGQAHEQAAMRRAQHFYQACGLLGVTYLRANIFEDQQSDTVSQLSINRAVVTLLPKSIDRVYTHSTADLNHDHRRVAEAVLVATRGLCPVYCCEPEWPGRVVRPLPERRWVTDISAVLERKLAACACYVDELREPPHPRSLAVLREKTVERFEVITDD